MRIHMIGSIPDNDYDRTAETIDKGLREHAEFFTAAAELGGIVGKRGHTLSIGSDFPLTIDHHLVRKGLIPVVRQHPERTFYVEVWRPNDRNRPFEDLRQELPNLKIEYFIARPGFPAQHRRSTTSNVVNTNLWTFAHQSAIANADVLVAMGGTSGTERAVHIAEQSGVPTLPISSFGGGAARAYEVLESSLISLPGAHALTAEWSARRAQDVVELAERVGTHSYFISYSHSHLEWCDLVHLALYTRGRVVLRDRGELSVGRAVQPKLMDAIGKAETFLLLWSVEAAASDWCKIELEHALKLNSNGLPPRRIVMLRRDKTMPPPQLADSLWLESSDRRQTDDAVNRVVAEERF